MGLANNIVCCELTPDVRKRLCKTPLDPAGVVVKFVSDKVFIKLPRLEYVACNTLLSNEGITPRLTYIDDNCMVNEYVAEVSDPRSIQDFTILISSFSIESKLQSRRRSRKGNGQGAGSCTRSSSLTATSNLNGGQQGVPRDFRQLEFKDCLCFGQEVSGTSREWRESPVEGEVL